MKKSDEIYRCIGTGLGDIIGSVMLYLRWSIERNEIIRVSTWYPRGSKIKDYKGKINEVLPLIDSLGSIELTDETPTSAHLPSEDIVHSFYRTHKKWNINNTSKIVAYQFDGKSHGEKNFSSFSDWDYITDFILSLDFIPVRLGSHLSIAECASILSNSHAFVGVPSGMGVLNFAVGAPHFMIRNELGEDWLKSIKYGPFMIMKTKEDFKDLFTAYISQGYPYFKENCINSHLCQ